MRKLILLALLVLTAAASAQENAAGPDKVVYHFSEGLEQASLGLQNIRNHLEANAKAEITVVALANGVDFLRKGAKTARGNEYRQQVEDLDLQGVKFRVCEITLRERGLKKEEFLPEARFVSSGVAEIARLQTREGHGYLRP
jgi:intracellular sulfur oxidation DsrE/DsrF family protein